MIFFRNFTPSDFQAKNFYTVKVFDLRHFSLKTECIKDQYFGHILVLNDLRLSRVEEIKAQKINLKCFNSLSNPTFKTVVENDQGSKGSGHLKLVRREIFYFNFQLQMSLIVFHIF